MSCTFDARQFRTSLVEHLAAHAKAREILDAAIWLVQEDEFVENRKHGATYALQAVANRDNVKSKQ